ncbi:uncharacterized protein VTP21DRAFT_1554 [Calcarisporiella thermophila]|uniref:uncharacterized protein n=1 Tax=Calcarisporiella thermophila TaxID=911321 RepID=UPI003742AC84
MTDEILVTIELQHWRSGLQFVITDYNSFLEELMPSEVFSARKEELDQFLAEKFPYNFWRCLLFPITYFVIMCVLGNSFNITKEYWWAIVLVMVLVTLIYAFFLIYIPIKYQRKFEKVFIPGLLALLGSLSRDDMQKYGLLWRMERHFSGLPGAFQAKKKRLHIHLARSKFITPMRPPHAAIHIPPTPYAPTPAPSAPPTYRDVPPAYSSTVSPPGMEDGA